MFGSLIYAMFLAPVLSSFILKEPKGDSKNKEFWMLRILNLVYKPVITYFVNNRQMAVWLAGGLIVVGLVIFPKLGSEFTPKLNEGTIVVRLTMAPSISLNESKNTTLIVERRLMRIPEITGVVTRIGRGEVGAHTDPINSAEIYVLLKQKTNGVRMQIKKF